MGIRLRLTGPDGRDYVPGEPIDVFDGEALIGEHVPDQGEQGHAEQRGIGAVAATTRWPS